MASKLLVRLFDVGLGDCIYCRIPGAHDDGSDFHMLIDCGTLSGMPFLEAALTNLKSLLPDAGGGKKRLNLLVVTHEHKDHMAGFGPDLWDDLVIDAIWMNAAMNPKHVESTKAKKLHGFAATAMAEAVRLNLALSPELQELASALAFSNDVATTTLRETLPKKNNIKPAYVHAGQTGAGLGLPLKGAQLHVLGPENDIDFFYLGKEGDPSLLGIMGVLGSAGVGVAAVDSSQSTVAQPSNLDPADFRQLRSRMLSTALAFADLDGKVTNNTSVVLLLEWKHKRLLFVGDAEWDSGFKPNRGNCAWNVMWNRQRGKLDAPIDFLKIGHHGSVNATPWNDNPAAPQGEPGDILDAILPIDGANRAKAVVSTRRGNYPTIPRAELLAEIGKRISNTRNYREAFAAANLETSDVPMFDEYERASFGTQQPLRTDLERMLDPKGFIDVEIAP